MKAVIFDMDGVIIDSEPLHYKVDKEILEASPEDCLVIEDSKSGTLAAKSAGMSCIGFLNPASGNQDLSAAGFRVNSMDEVLDNLQFSDGGSFQFKVFSQGSRG